MPSLITVHKTESHARSEGSFGGRSPVSPKRGVSSVGDPHTNYWSSFAIVQDEEVVLYESRNGNSSIKNPQLSIGS